MRYIVLFERDRKDDVFEPLGRLPTPKESYDQLLTELSEAHLKLTLLGAVQPGGDYDVFAVTVEWETGYATLAAYLQEMYDDYGVAGWFQIVGKGDVSPL